MLRNTDEVCLPSLEIRKKLSGQNSAGAKFSVQVKYKLNKTMWKGHSQIPLTHFHQFEQEKS